MIHIFLLLILSFAFRDVGASAPCNPSSGTANLPSCIGFWCLTNGQLRSVSNVVFVNASMNNVVDVIENAGPDSVVIVDGTDGNVNAHGAIDMPKGQMIMGGGSSLEVVECSNPNNHATFVAPGMRGTLTNANGFMFGDLLRASNKAVIQSVDLESSMPSLDGVVRIQGQDVLLEDVSIVASGASPLAKGLYCGGTSSFTVRGGSISSSDGYGIVVYSDEPSDSVSFQVFNASIITWYEEIYVFSDKDVNSGWNGGGDIDATIINNTIVSNDADSDEIRAETQLGNVCLNVTRNTLDDGSGSIYLRRRNSAPAGALKVVQKKPKSGGPLSINIANGIPEANVAAINIDKDDYNQVCMPQ